MERSCKQSLQKIGHIIKDSHHHGRRPPPCQHKNEINVLVKNLKQDFIFFKGILRQNVV